MESLVELLKIGMICLVVLVLGVAALVAFPRSNLGPIAKQLTGWGIAVVTALYVISPIDVVPDFIPLAGQADDVIALVVGIAAARSAFKASKEGPPARRLR